MIKTMMKKRFVFLFLVSCLSMAISAQAVVYISTADQLYDIRNDPTGDYKLTADIDMSTLTANGGVWIAIGNSLEPVFSGTFDGDYHTISNLVGIDPDGTANGYKTGGLFGKVGNIGSSLYGVVKNVGLVNPDVQAGNYVAALVGDLNYGEISNSFVSGGSVINNFDSANIGSLVALVRNGSTVTNCWSDAHVQLWNDAWNVGWPENRGGFMNNSVDPESTSYCYFAGTLGCIIGGEDVGYSEGIGGPFRGAGLLEGLLSCYYDSDTTGVPGGTVANNPPGLSTAEMMDPTTYVGWDFGSTWTMIPGVTYPKLAGFGLLAAGNPVPYGGVVPTNTTELCWSPPEIDADGDPITGDITYDVYFGEDPNTVEPAPYGLGNLIMGTSLTCVPLPPGSLETNGVYYWMVVCHTDGGDIAGLLWPLETAKTNASSPSPADGEPGAPKNAQLSWTSGEDEFGGLPLSHKLYLDPNATYVTERNCGAVAVCVTLDPGVTTYDPDLEWGVTYYWVVDEDYGGAVGIEEGDVWSFTVDPELECGLLPGDLTEDCIVNLDDFAVLAFDWLNCLIINDDCPPGYN